MPSISIKEYFAQAGSRFNNNDARVIGPVLQEIASQGLAAATDVLEAAHSANSPLREYFEWDNEKAGHLYRLSQAEEIVNCVRVRYVSNEREYASRAFKVLVVPQDSKPKERQIRVPQEAATPGPIARVPDANNGYSFADAHADFNERVSVALRELDQWRLKWKPFVARFARFEATFLPVLNQIGEFKEEFEREGGDATLEQDLLAPLIAWKGVAEKVSGLGGEIARQVEYMIGAIEDAQTAHANLNNGVANPLKKSQMVDDWRPSSDQPDNDSPPSG